MQRILTGEQYMTVYKAIKPEAEAAAEIAVALAEGEECRRTKSPKKSTTAKDVPSVILAPVAVARTTSRHVIKDGFVTASELCTGAYAQACKEAGISG